MTHQDFKTLIGKIFHGLIKIAMLGKSFTPIFYTDQVYGRFRLFGASHSHCAEA